MDISVISQLVSSLGFPIVLCGGFLFFIYKKDQQEREDTNKREERMYAQLAMFGASLERFNITLTAIDKRLEVLEKKDVK